MSEAHLEIKRRYLEVRTNAKLTFKPDLLYSDMKTTQFVSWSLLIFQNILLSLFL